MPLPVIKFAEKYDGWGFWRDGKHQREWAIDFTATWAKELHWPKKRLTWFIDGTVPRSELKRLILLRAVKEQIVHLYVHRTLKPMDEEHIRYIEQIARDLEKEKEGEAA